MKELIEKITICLLSPRYFKIITKAASLWVTLPYTHDYAREAWYWENLSKIKGYILTGFKINWPDNTKPLSGNNLLDFFLKVPVEMIFVREELYNEIISIENNGCMVEVTKYGKAKTEYRELKRTLSCSVATSFMKELNEEELRKIKAIDAFIGGGF